MYRVIFPHLIMDSDAALVMREAIIEALLRVFESRLAADGWAQAVDNAVYFHAGLRLIHSLKMIPCPACKGRGKMADGQRCLTCPITAGRVDEQPNGRPYDLYQVYDDGARNADVTADLQRNTKRRIMWASIRCVEEQTKITQGWTKYTGCPSHGDYRTTPTGAKPISREKVFGKETKSKERWRTKTEIKDPEIWKIAEHYIHNRFGVAHYKATRITSIVADDKRTAYFVRVDGEGSNYCMNLRGDHNRNRIYFIMDKKGMSQMCFCRCPKTEGRIKGMCKDFRSPAKLFNDLECGKLFSMQSLQKPGPAFLTQNPVTFSEALETELFNDARGPPKRPKK